MGVNNATCEEQELTVKNYFEDDEEQAFYNHMEEYNKRL